ncbi:MULTISPECIES: tetratricopeptide repeat protein [unclassified Lysobacter]|uniref:tetratricopeptide repeat protein n=1 Tax=unclassified Lysobacter TaxID=2635362 RepID=UPI001BE99E57|nr:MULTISPECIES: tetratricopeptide repeat protein [unclassified Lysobacter]MBT2747928.1 tetratricopeptide repeat protein [Lysobacter sp. ISL-42]MBT2753732.1 tetratricopeptide repeat protein [Lysobacter sp. ISL-50]MBT2779229.1 tetratricopeptide repeat protein [Lysobacter sp. ISL-54]
MSRLSSRLFFYAAALVTIGLYWSGLKGPFILDDAFNIDPLQNWISGQASVAEVIFGNASGVLGRPVSMATLWLSAATGGIHPFPFKFGNLLIHLVCGALAWQVVRRMLARDRLLAPHAEKIGVLVAAIWLIHPINVSTVLYAVQRMAQLSSLFTLVAIWIYLSGRTKLEAGELRGGAARLFLAFPVALLLGVLSKENAAVAPALCLILEIAYFRSWRQSSRVLTGFYLAFLALPALAAFAMILRSPDHFLVGYASRDFTLFERLLSQPRALMEYIGLIAWPRGGLMGVFVDDFRASHGLWSPPSTFFALLALLSISIAAIALRRRAPSVFAGWFFYLVAQGVESSILPLELYFEHRNYLPSIGLLVALVGLRDLLPESWSFARPSKTRALYLAFALAAAALSWITWNQVQVWRSEASLIEQTLANRPGSTRAMIVKAAVALRESRYQEARATTMKIALDKDQPARLQGYFSTIIVDCWWSTGGEAKYLQEGATSFKPPIHLSDALTSNNLLDAIDQKRCGPEITYARVADALDKILAAAPTQPETSRAKWMLRTMAATANLRADRWQQAQAHAEKAWNPSADPAVGGLLARIYIHNGRKAEAQRTLDEVTARVRSFERIANSELSGLREAIQKMPSPGTTDKATKTP